MVKRGEAAHVPLAQGASMENKAKLLPFTEKQTLGSLPGILKDARAALEALKAG